MILNIIRIKITFTVLNLSKNKILSMSNLNYLRYSLSERTRNAFFIMLIRSFLEQNYVIHP